MMVVLLFISGKDSIQLRQDVHVDNLELICIEIEPSKSKSFLVQVWYQRTSDPVKSFNKLENVLSFLDKEGEQNSLLRS